MDIASSVYHDFVRLPIANATPPGSWPFGCDKLFPCQEVPHQTCGCNNSFGQGSLAVVYNLNLGTAFYIFWLINAKAKMAIFPFKSSICIMNMLRIFQTPPPPPPIKCVFLTMCNLPKLRISKIGHPCHTIYTENTIGMKIN